jgi:phosphoribosylformylglycinamidine synthase
MGIPTVNGAVYFDPRYLGNPLVYCGCLGLIPKDKIEKASRPGDIVLVVGGRTGRDGIHGATFSSAELTDTHHEEFAHAVQIGNAITEKIFTDVILQARDYKDGCLYSAITDCGAGGLSSAVGEMAERIGAEIDLEKVPLKYAGLRYDEIWISEAQERMVLAVPPENLDTILGLFAAEDVEATVIGTFRSDGQLILRYGGTQVGQIDCHFLHNGVPGLNKTATWTRQLPKPPKESHVSIYEETGPLRDRLLKLLAHPTLASKHWVIRQYDHEVQGGSAVKPLTGKHNDGPSDAAVIRPLLNLRKGVAIANGLAPHWSDWDPYWMAVASVDEAIRNVTCSGADPDRIAILDNFCWGKPDDPEMLGSLVRAAQGAHDAAVVFDAPFISGKDSLNNEFSLDPTDAKKLGFEKPRISIPGTLLISAIGIVEDVEQAASMDLKAAGNTLLLVGPSWAWPDVAGNLPFDWQIARSVQLAVSQLVRGKQVASAHDCSEGGILAAVAEMCLAGRRGATLDVAAAARPKSGLKWTSPTVALDKWILAEAPSRYILEVTAAQLAAVTAGLGSVPWTTLGTTGEEGQPLMVQGVEKDAVRLDVEELRKAWTKTLDW